MKKMIELYEQGINLENHTLILPSMGRTNVGQLSVDLLITNLNLRKIGRFFYPLVSVVSDAPYNYLNDMGTIEIYAGSEKCIVALKVCGYYILRNIEFLDELKKFITQRNITKVIMLTQHYEDRDIQSPHIIKLRYVASPSLYSESGKLFEELSWIPHTLQVQQEPSDRLQEKFISKDTFGTSIFDFLCNANIPCAILFKFCRGDNISDAIDLLYYLNQWIYLLEITSENTFKNLKFPPFWIKSFKMSSFYKIFLN